MKPMFYIHDKYKNFILSYMSGINSVY